MEHGRISRVESQEILVDCHFFPTFSDVQPPKRRWIIFNIPKFYPSLYFLSSPIIFSYVIYSLSYKNITFFPLSVIPQLFHNKNITFFNQNSLWKSSARSNLPTGLPAEGKAGRPQIQLTKEKYCQKKANDILYLTNTNYPIKCIYETKKKLIQPSH